MTDEEREFGVKTACDTIVFAATILNKERKSTVEDMMALALERLFGREILTEVLVRLRGIQASIKSAANDEGATQ